MHKIIQSKNTLTADFKESKVVFDAAACMPYILNSTASEIWGLLRSARTVRDITGFLRKQYAIGPGIAEKDARRIVRDLKEKGLICYEQEGRVKTQ
ncbi:MAG: PqqD family protein [Candidatus Omnitrophica bacterium]|nr:PqqD family protein [Candidatus Omnitrophota bacterium]